MTYRPGDTFLIQYPPSSSKLHLHVVLCDEDGYLPCVLIVPINTRTTLSDTTTILQPGDHPFITHESVVTYELMASVYVAQIDDDLISTKPPFNKATLDKIVDGALKSIDTPKGMKKVLKERLGIS